MDDEKKVDENVEQAEEKVAEDATPETPTEAVEQRTDDYDGLVRRIDEVLDLIDKVLAAVERVESFTGAFVDGGATVREGADDISEDVVEDSGINDIAGEIMDEVVNIDDLDLS